MPFPQSVFVRNGDYTDVQRIGQGGAGQVYSAREVGLRRTVAVKEALRTNADFARVRAKFQRESQIQAELGARCPEIVRVNTLLTDPDTQELYLICEYMDGDSLDKHLQTYGPLSEIDAIRVALNVCAALDAAWAKRIVHRDIKPANIMLTTDGQGQIYAKLGDFGVADDGTETRVAGSGYPGTPLYMSPEQSNSQNDLDVRSDLYSLGITLWQMLTNTHYKLVAAQSPDPALAQHSAQTSAGIAQIIAIAIQDDPARRYQTPGAMAGDLRRLLSDPTFVPARTGQVVQVGHGQRGNAAGRTRGAGTQTTTHSPQRPGFLFFMAGPLIAIVALLAWFFWPRTAPLPPPPPTASVAATVLPTRSAIAATTPVPAPTAVSPIVPTAVASPAPTLPPPPVRLQLASETLARIFLGQITRWNDPHIQADNPGVTLPDLPITVVYRQDGSGTTEIFTNYLSLIDERWLAGPGRGEIVQWPVGVPAHGNEGVAEQVATTPGAIGYVASSYAQDKDLPAALIQNFEGEFVRPGPANIIEATMNIQLKDDMIPLLVDLRGRLSYSITSFTWIIVCREMQDRTQAEALTDFLYWTLSNPEAQRSVEQTFYTRLPDNIRTRSIAQLSKITVDGQPVFTPPANPQDFRPRALSITVNGSGATFSDPLYQRWIEQYRAFAPDVNINYEPVGSTQGRINLVSDVGQFQFAGSDVPASSLDLQSPACTPLHIPTQAGAVVVMYNLPAP